MSTHKVDIEYRNWKIKDLSELRSWLFRQKHLETNKQLEADLDRKILKIEAELRVRGKAEGEEHQTRAGIEKVTSRKFDGNFGIKKGVIG